jgi:hypothetical protein
MDLFGLEAGLCAVLFFFKIWVRNLFFDSPIQYDILDRDFMIWLGKYFLLLDIHFWQ